MISTKRAQRTTVLGSRIPGEPFCMGPISNNWANPPLNCLGDLSRLTGYDPRCHRSQAVELICFPLDFGEVSVGARGLQRSQERAHLVKGKSEQCRGLNHSVRLGRKTSDGRARKQKVCGPVDRKSHPPYGIIYYYLLTSHLRYFSF